MLLTWSILVHYNFQHLFCGTDAQWMTPKFVCLVPTIVLSTWMRAQQGTLWASYPDCCESNQALLHTVWKQFCLSMTYILTFVSVSLSRSQHLHTKPSFLFHLLSSAKFVNLLHQIITEFHKVSRQNCLQPLANFTAVLICKHESYPPVKLLHIIKLLPKTRVLK